jgi:ribosomal protein L22
MADEKKSGTRASSSTGSQKDAGTKKPAAPKKPAAGKKPAAEKKPAAKPRAKTTPKSEEAKTAAKPRARKPAAAKSETKAETKPAARRRPAAKKPASETKAPAKAEAPKPKPAPRKREAPERPLVRAQAKYVRSSARKARLVMDHVRGRSVADARALLRHSPRGVARDVERLLNSAIANAENNHELVGDDLYVKEIYADEGPTLRRFRPRAQGRATRIRKRTSHLTVGLSTKE